MMQIHHLSSGSHGNATLVGDGHSWLLLDCGLTYRKLVEGLRKYGARPIELAGVLLTHEHMDHAKGSEEMLRRGIRVYMSLGTADALGFAGGYLDGLLMKHSYQRKIGTWMVVPFNLNHDAAEPMGFLFESNKTGGKGLYIVDSAIVDFAFTGITHFLIECNHSGEIIEAGNYHPALKKRVEGNHMSLENLKVFLETSDLRAAEEIHLLHLSDANSDEQSFIDEIQRLTGVPTFAP